MKEEAQVSILDFHLFVDSTHLVVRERVKKNRFAERGHYYPITEQEGC